MPIKILMPALSPTMEHGNIAKWVKKEGDSVAAGEVMAEIETDKATMEVEAVDEGIIGKIVEKEGAKDVAVNSLIAVLLEEGESSKDIDKFIADNAAQKTKPQAENKDQKEKTIDNKNSADKKEQVVQSEPEPVRSMPINKPSPILKGNTRLFASPLAKRIAKNEGIDLSTLIGTGPHGRIVKDNVLAANSNKRRIVRHPQEYHLVENNNIRKVIAKRLLESKQNIPHFYLSIECMMDSLLDVRMQINKNFGNDKSKKISVNDFVILATAKALKDVPDANASWSENAMMIYNNIDISVAVAINGGLITPIVRNADQKDLTMISVEMKDLVKRARDNQLKPEEYQGGGFSISNLGMYGIKSFNAIINPPQGCILSVGASTPRSVVVDNKIEIRTIMDVNLSCDHRVVDGAVGALFLNALKKYIESPILMFI